MVREGECAVMSGCFDFGAGCPSAQHDRQLCIVNRALRIVLSFRAKRSEVEESRRSCKRESMRIAMVNVLQSRDLSTSRRRRFAQGDRLLIMYNHRNTFFSFRKKSYFCIANNSLYYFLRCGFVGGIILNKYAQNRWGLAARERYTNEPVKRRGVVCSCAYFFIIFGPHSDADTPKGRLPAVSAEQHPDSFPFPSARLTRDCQPLDTLFVALKRDKVYSFIVKSQTRLKMEKNLNAVQEEPVRTVIPELPEAAVPEPELPEEYGGQSAKAARIAAVLAELLDPAYVLLFGRMAGRTPHSDTLAYDLLLITDEKPCYDWYDARRYVGGARRSLCESLYVYPAGGRIASHAFFLSRAEGGGAAVQRARTALQASERPFRFRVGRSRGRKICGDLSPAGGPAGGLCRGLSRLGACPRIGHCDGAGGCLLLSHAVLRLSRVRSGLLRRNAAAPASAHLSTVL